MRKSQAGMEYLLISGFILFIIIPIFYFALLRANNTVHANKAEETVKALANAADIVYSLGPGARKSIWVDMPSDVQELSIYNKTVLMRVNIYGGLSDVYEVTKANITGSIPSSPGLHKVLFEMSETGEVVISNITA